MAKIFRTEKLSLNGDSIRIKSENAGEFEITDSNENVLISRATIESDISSLATASSLTEKALNSDVSSLAASISGNTTELDSDISSLAAEVGTNDSDLSSLAAVDVSHDSDISSLATASSLTAKELDSDVSSLAALIVSNDIYATGIALSDQDTYANVDYTSLGYTKAPAVVGTLMGNSADAPIIGVQLSGVTTSTATFIFSDEIPGDNVYTLEVLVSPIV